MYFIRGDVRFHPPSPPRETQLNPMGTTEFFVSTPRWPEGGVETKEKRISLPSFFLC